MRPDAGSRSLLLADVVAALALTAVYVVFVRMGPDDGQASYAGPLWLGYLVAAAAGLPVAARRLWPIPVLATVVAALVVATMLDIVREPYAAAGLAAYLVALAEPTRRSTAALAVVLPAAGAAVYVGGAVVTPTEDPQGAFGLVGLVVLVLGGAWTAGFVVRGRRAEAERRRRDESERALEEERLTIARELHDIVSHHLSLIAVRAGVAGHVADEEPAEARAALHDIEETSRSALDEMRRTLGVLRGDGDARRPAPSLGGLDALAADARRAGVDVVLSTDGASRLPAGVQATVHRIVQEALTNVVRHAAPTRCAVTVAATDAGTAEVRVDVVDDGPPLGRRPGRRALPGGHGLVGVEERVGLLGGTFAAGPRPGGGFALSARWPVGEGRLA
ncbi:sensor histidine kinase [Isoptericola sp. F-RaC21]|uniref:sensor histidine kinase n=1 Tax=Isoptericola sp. F-RaC21 TaxID=3141452 RepID=UPI00315BD5A1